MNGRGEKEKEKNKSALHQGKDILSTASRKFGTTPVILSEAAGWV
jgi:hypothetical protein